MGTVVHINGDQIRDADTFHDVFATTFGFPGFYGRNMNAWIDCMTCLGDPDAGMTTIHVEDGDVITLVVDNIGSLKERCPALYSDLIECTAFVNRRLVERGFPPVLAIALYADSEEAEDKVRRKAQLAGVTEDTAKAFIVKELAIGIEQDDWFVQSELVSMAYSISNPDIKADILNTLLLMPGHRFHQEITRAIQKLGHPSSVPYIDKVLSNGFGMFEYNASDDGVIAKWFSHALADIGTDEAIKIIQKFAQSPNGEIADEMKYRLEKIRTYRVNRVKPTSDMPPSVAPFSPAVKPASYISPSNTPLPPTSARVILRDERTPGDFQHLSAHYSAEGDLVIEGQDLGETVQRAFGYREYEWRWVIRSADLPKLSSALAEEGDLLGVLGRRFSGPNASHLYAFLQEHQITVDSSSRIGD